MIALLAAALIGQDATIDLPNDVTRLADLGSHIIASGRDNIYAIDPGSWEIVKRHDLNAMNGEHYIGAGGGRVLLVSSDGIEALTPDLSKQAWRKKIKGVAMEARAMGDGILVIYQDSMRSGVVQSAKIHDPKKGKTRASLDPAFAHAWILRVGKEGVLFGEKPGEETPKGNVAAYDASGAKLWAQSMGLFRPMGLDAKAHVFGRVEKDGSTTMKVIDAKSGKELFTRKLTPGIGCGGSAGGLVFTFENTPYTGTKLTAWDLSGKEKWTGRIPVSPRRIIGTESGLAVETSRGTVGLDPANGATRWDLRRTRFLHLKTVGTDVYDPVMAISPPSVTLSVYRPGNVDSVQVVEIGSGKVRKELEPGDIRWAILVGSKWIVSADVKIKVFDLSR
jgi:hypothetical protein